MVAGLGVPYGVAQVFVGLAKGFGHMLHLLPKVRSGKIMDDPPEEGIRAFGLFPSLHIPLPSRLLFSAAR